MDGAGVSICEAFQGVADVRYETETLKFLDVRCGQVAESQHEKFATALLESRRTNSP
jgi:hypothetical protein